MDDSMTETKITSDQDTLIDTNLPSKNLVNPDPAEMTAEELSSFLDKQDSPTEWP